MSEFPSGNPAHFVSENKGGHHLQFSINHLRMKPGLKASLTFISSAGS